MPVMEKQFISVFFRGYSRICFAGGFVAIINGEVQLRGDIFVWDCCGRRKVNSNYLHIWAWHSRAWHSQINFATMYLAHKAFMRFDIFLFSRSGSVSAAGGSFTYGTLQKIALVSCMNDRTAYQGN